MSFQMLFTLFVFTCEENTNMKSTQEQKAADVPTPLALTAAEKAEKKRIYNRLRMAAIRAEAAHSLEAFMNPFNRAKNTKRAEEVYGCDDIGTRHWNGRALDGTYLSPEMRCLLVLNKSLTDGWDSEYFEVPHFGGDDDAEILKSNLTVHQATVIASNVSFVNGKAINLEFQVQAMEKKLEEMENQVAALTLALTS
jgi:hypothetical protein